MSPSRSSRRQPVPHRRDRSDIVKAALASAAIVGATALLVWLLRPGPAGIPATGGLMNRQPRVSWLIVGAVALAGGAVWWALGRGNRNKRRARMTLAISLGVILAGAVVLGFLWPGGLLRHDVAHFAEPPTSTPSTTPTTPSTPATGPSGASGASGSSGASGATGASGSSGASGATGTSGAAATTLPSSAPTKPPANPPR